MSAKRKLIRRNAHKMIAKIFEDSTTAKVYTLNNGFVGESVGVEWVKEHTANISHAEHYDNLNGTYTIRIHSNLWYELAGENTNTGPDSEPDVIRIKLSYVLNGAKRSGECWVKSLDSMAQIATDLELIADGPILVSIETGEV